LTPRYVESSAYHESAHIVIAAVQNLPLRPRCLRIDPAGNGLTVYASRQPDKSRNNVGSDIERERTIISIMAGWRAQNIFYPCARSGAFCDINEMNALLDEMYSDVNQWFEAKKKLWYQTEALVKFHWSAIQAVAVALWAKPWAAREPDPENQWSAMSEEKTLNGVEVKAILSNFQIQAIVVERAQAASI
jgi:hypothetical protein